MTHPRIDWIAPTAILLALFGWIGCLPLATEPIGQAAEVVSIVPEPGSRVKLGDTFEITFNHYAGKLTVEGGTEIDPVINSIAHRILIQAARITVAWDGDPVGNESGMTTITYRLASE